MVEEEGLMYKVVQTVSGSGQLCYVSGFGLSRLYKTCLILILHVKLKTSFSVAKRSNFLDGANVRPFS